MLAVWSDREEVGRRQVATEVPLLAAAEIITTGLFPEVYLVRYPLIPSSHSNQTLRP